MVLIRQKFLSCLSMGYGSLASVLPTAPACLPAPDIPALPSTMNINLSRRLSCMLLLLAGAGLLTAAESPGALDTVEKSAGDWLKVRAETARLETEWASQKQLLDSLVQGLEERAQSLEVKRDYLRAKTAKDRDDFATLETANKAASAGLNSAEESLKEIGPRLFQLRASLPPRLSEALEMSYKSLASADLPLSERMQLTMTVLNRCLQFNRSIICEEQVLAIGGEGSRQLEVIYWGLSHGYALDRPTGKVWLGSPGPTGWQWESIPDASDRVAKLIAIYRGKVDPEFIEIPVGAKNQPAVAAQK